MKDEMKTNPSCDFISRADAIEAIASAEPKDNEYHYYKHIAIKILSEIPSAEATIGDYPNDLISRSALMEYCSNQKSKSIDNNDIARFPSTKAKGDLISRQDAMNTIKRYKHRLQGKGQTYGFLLEEFEHQIPSIEVVQGWIPFTRRPMTEEEQEYYPNCTFMFDCVLPDDGDEILVSNRRFVWMDTFCSDIDGCYLDSGDDIDEDMAWMPLPKPYKGGAE